PVTTSTLVPPGKSSGELELPGPGAPAGANSHPIMMASARKFICWLIPIASTCEQFTPRTVLSGGPCAFAGAEPTTTKATTTIHKQVLNLSNSRGQQSLFVVRRFIMISRLCLSQWIENGEFRYRGNTEERGRHS